MTFDELNNLKAVARKYGGLNLGEVDQLISTAERHLASAEQIRQMREALEDVLPAMRCLPDRTENDHINEGIRLAHARGMKARALTPSQAEATAAANAEKAALLEWWFDEANEEARETIRFERWASDSPWTAQQWIEAVRKVKETPNAK